jgi:hypothetical protein
MSAFNAITSIYNRIDMATARGIARQPHRFSPDDREEARSLLNRFYLDGTSKQHHEAKRLAERLTKPIIPDDYVPF